MSFKKGDKVTLISSDPSTLVRLGQKGTVMSDQIFYDDSQEVQFEDVAQIVAIKSLELDKDYPSLNSTNAINNTMNTITNETQNEALKQIEPKAPKLRETVVNLLADATDGLTASEIIQKTGALDYSIRPRLTELKAAGRAYVDGKRKNSRGKNEAVWKLTVQTTVMNPAA